MRVLILGGTGRQAESILLDLLGIDTDNISQITLASRNGPALRKRAEGTGNPKVKWAVVDIADHVSLVKLAKRHDLVMNAANTLTVLPAVKAALEAGVNVASLEGLNQHMVVPEAPCDEFGFVLDSYLAQLDESFREAGIIGVLGWGYVPGTTNILGRFLGDRFDSIDSMTWYYAAAQCGDRLFFSETPRETIWLHHQPGLILKDGKYTPVPPRSGREKVRFPDPIGEVEVQHMPLMSTVPVFAKRYQQKGIKNIDVKVGYWAGYLEKMDFLQSVGLLDLEPRVVGGVAVAPADVFLSGPGVAEKGDAPVADWGCVRLVVNGVIAGHNVTCVGEVLARPMRNLGAMQLLTGIPAAIGIQMIAQGKLRKTGLYTTEDDSIDALTYFEELGRRNYRVAVTSTEVIVD